MGQSACSRVSAAPCSSLARAGRLEAGGPNAPLTPGRGKSEGPGIPRMSSRELTARPQGASDVAPVRELSISPRPPTEPPEPVSPTLHETESTGDAKQKTRGLKEDRHTSVPAKSKKPVKSKSVTRHHRISWACIGRHVMAMNRCQCCRFMFCLLLTFGMLLSFPIWDGWIWRLVSPLPNHNHNHTRYPVCPLFPWNYPKTGCFDPACGGTYIEAKSSNHKPNATLLRRLFGRRSHRQELGEEPAGHAGNGIAMHTPSQFINGSYTGPIFDIVFITPSGNISGIADLPDACFAIYKEGVANATIAAACDAWCDLVLGRTVHLPLSPVCMSLGSAPAYVNSVCGKAETSRFFSKYPIWTPFPISFAYMFIGLLIAACRSCKQHDYQSLTEIDEEALNEEPCPGVLQTSCRPDGPFGNGRLPMPFCFVKCQSDSQGARIRMILHVVVALCDPAIDVAMLVSYLLHGQPFYALVTFVGIAALRDPFHAGFFLSLRSYVKNGFATRECLHYMCNEGAVEARFCGVAAYWSFTCAAPAHIEPITVALQLCSIVRAFVFTMPHASEARFIHMVIDEERLDPTDFYVIEEVRAEFSRLRWFDAALTVNLASVVVVAQLFMLHLDGFVVSIFCTSFLAVLAIWHDFREGEKWLFSIFVAFSAWLFLLASCLGESDMPEIGYQALEHLRSGSWIASMQTLILTLGCFCGFTSALRCMTV